MNPDGTSSAFSASFTALEQQLACPACYAALRLNDELVCSGCGRTYPVIDGIPLLIASPAEPDPDSS